MNIPPSETDSDEDDDYEIIGVRRTQHNTSFARRYSSLSVNESIKLRELEEAAETVLSFQHVIHILSTITLTLATRLRAYTSIDIIVEVYRIILALLALCDNEMNVLTEVEVDIRALRSEDRPPLVLHPPKNRTIDELDPAFALGFTRFTKEQLHKLFVHLRLPNTVILPRRRYRFSGEEVLIICLARLATGDPWNRLIPSNFGGGLARWGDAFEWFVQHIFVNFYNKISGNSMARWAGKMVGFRRLMHQKITSPPCDLETWANLGAIDSELGLYLVDIPFESFLCAMLVDDTNVRTTRPGSGPDGNYALAPRRMGGYFIQRAFYSGYFRGHGLKYQHILLPNGLFGSVWGTSQTYNDVGLANMSGLENYLFAVLDEDENGNLPCVLADGIFCESAVVMTTKLREGANEDERRLYCRLASIRQPIELQYGNFFEKFQLFKNKNAFRLFNKAEIAYRTGIVGFFLLNCHTCLNDSIVNSYFNNCSPTIEDYLPLDEDLIKYTR